MTTEVPETPDAQLPETEHVPAETSTGLSENVLGALAYLFAFVSGLLVYFLEGENEFARYHAAQSIVLSAAGFALMIGFSVMSSVVALVLGEIPLLGLLVGIGMLFVSAALGLVGLVLWLYLMVSAFRGKRTRLPVVTNVAETYLL
ncbi:DUF4870 domain-containing protein [Natrononativus amylolyticus]|uniref:DUF4870 domain-containing protein n=1 Tax=Natrononativus amylolyticus TaxID=2963434 RepID=UPI0020CBD810|nr:hypothetical protein [Natrononativus amylolyticus]